MEQKKRPILMFEASPPEVEFIPEESVQAELGVLLDADKPEERVVH